MAHQEIFSARTVRRGSLEMTDEVVAVVSRSGVVAGMAHVFVRHTSCGLMITETVARYLAGQLPAGAPQPVSPAGDRCHSMRLMPASAVPCPFWQRYRHA